MKRILLMAAIILLTLGSIGCGSMYTSLQRPPDTKAMTVSDVVALSKANVGDSVVVAQIKATEAVFALTDEDVAKLKEAGVSDEVIKAMLAAKAPQAKKNYASRRSSRRFFGPAVGAGHHHHGARAHGRSGRGGSHGGRPRSFGRR